MIRPEQAEGVSTLHARNAARTRAEVFRCAGREWDLLPGVFSPRLDETTATFTEMLRRRTFTTLIDVGTGTGVTGLTVALERDCAVVCTDLVAEAVANAAVNSERHGLAHRVPVLHGDLLDPVPPVENATAYWNSAFIDAAPDTDDALATAFYDPGYTAHARLFDQARARDDIREILLGFSTVGDLRKLRAIAAERGWFVREIESAASRRVPGLTFQLITLEERQ